MKKYRNSLYLAGFAALILVMSFTACEKIEEVPPAKKSINEIYIKLLDVPKITESEQKVIDEIKAEHEASTKKK